MIIDTEPTDADVLKLIKAKAEAKQLMGQNWIIGTCNQQITEMEMVIGKLRRLVDLCKNPEVIEGIEIFLGKFK